MGEITIASLDARQRKLVENAHVALQRGNLDYAYEACAQVLRTSPACLTVRKLKRLVQLRQLRVKGEGVFAKVASGFSSAPFFFGAAKKEPAKMLELAESVLEKHPNNVYALKLLATAAEKLGWPGTVAFALEAVREIEPENRGNLLELGEAWLAAGEPKEALRIADDLLRERPVDGAAQDLMRRASVAETIDKGGWENVGTFREQMCDESQGTSPAIISSEKPAPFRDRE